MDMNSDDSENPAPQYAEEVLCANWNPLALMLAEPPARVPGSVFEGVDIEAFLARLYLCQRA
jgi:hypothetical protein